MFQPPTQRLRERWRRASPSAEEQQGTRDRVTSASITPLLQPSAVRPRSLSKVRPRNSHATPTLQQSRNNNNLVKCTQQRKPRNSHVASPTTNYSRNNTSLSTVMQLHQPCNSQGQQHITQHSRNNASRKTASQQHQSWNSHATALPSCFCQQSCNNTNLETVIHTALWTQPTLSTPYFEHAPNIHRTLHNSNTLRTLIAHPYTLHTS